MSERLPLALAADHPVFAGHFPGQPIVPGALLLDLAIHAINAHSQRSVQHISQAKFLSPALPGEAIEAEFEIDGDSLRLTLRSGARSLATARLGLAPA